MTPTTLSGSGSPHLCKHRLPTLHTPTPKAEWCVGESRLPPPPGGQDFINPLDADAPRGPLVPRIMEMDILGQRKPDALLGELTYHSICTCSHITHTHTHTHTHEQVIFFPILLVVHHQRFPPTSWSPWTSTHWVGQVTNQPVSHHPLHLKLIKSKQVFTLTSTITVVSMATHTSLQYEYPAEPTTTDLYLYTSQIDSSHVHITTTCIHMHTMCS